MNNEYKTKLEWAQYYVNVKKWSVIPLMPKSKKPAKSWKEYQRRFPTDEELNEWFKEDKNEIGIVTGELSAIAVIDFDSKEAFALFAEQHGIPETPVALTGKGAHLYCKYSGNVRNWQRRPDLKDIDLRGEGGYVVAPPSRHYTFDKTGRQYRWYEDSLNYSLAELPPIILQSSVATTQSTDIHTDTNIENIDELIAQINECCSFLKHCYLNQENISEIEWYMMLSNICRLREGRELCHRYSERYRGYSYTETDRKIDHALKDTGPYTCHSIKMNFDCGNDCMVTSPIVNINRLLNISLPVVQDEIAHILGVNHNIFLPYGFHIKGRDLLFTKEDVRGKSRTVNVCPFFIIAGIVEGQQNSYMMLKSPNKEKIIPLGISEKKQLAEVFANFLHTYFDPGRLGIISYYLGEYLALNKLMIPRYLGLDKTGWKGDTFYLPSREHQDIVWLDDRVKEAFCCNGSLESQEVMFKQLLNTKVSLVILAALSAPLLKKMNVQNYVVHISGLQGKGKSAGVHFTMSLFGHPRELFNSWNATKVGKEILSLTYDNLPLWIDELETAGKKLNDVLNYFYEFESGTGRTRARKDITLQKRHKFSSVLLSTGEKDLDAIVSALRSERTAPLGVYRRTIELQADDTFYTPLSGGAFTEEQRTKFIEGIYGFADGNYGLLGKNWIEYCEQNLNILKSMYKEKSKQVRNTGSMDKIFALLLTVLHSSWMQQYLTLNEIRLIERFIVEIGNDQHKKNIAVKDLAEEFMQKLADYIFMNKQRFVNMSYIETELRNGALGEIIEVRDQSDRNIVLSHDVFLLSSTLDIVCREGGFVKSQVVKALHQRDLLEKTSDGTGTTYTRVIRFLGKPTRGYYILGVFAEKGPKEYLCAA